MTILTQNTINYVTDFVTGKIKLDNDTIKNNLILSYLSDKNSSTLREAITANICGYKWSSEKLGYDAFDESRQLPVEIKPKLKTKSGFNGNGNFSDLTPEKVNEMLQNNLIMVSSLFHNSQLIHVIEFPFLVIHPVIEKQVFEKCVINKQKQARSANFSSKDYHDSDIKIHYLNAELSKINNSTFLHKRLLYGNTSKLFE
jgi:hypothetical protein